MTKVPWPAADGGRTLRHRVEKSESSSKTVTEWVFTISSMISQYFKTLCCLAAFEMRFNTFTGGMGLGQCCGDVGDGNN